MFTRRDFIKLITILSFLPKIALASNSIQLRAEPVKLKLLANSPKVDFWGLNGSTPGETIRVKKGEKITASFINELPQNSSLHWHGIRIKNDMDGVPGLTQDSVKPKSSFLYDFIVPDSGTYWYHSHDRSWEQVARGLYGAIIVEENNPPKVDQDIIVFIDDWLIDDKGKQETKFDDIHDQVHWGRIGNFSKAIFNGVSSPVKQNQRLRIRLINVATDRIFPLTIKGIKGKVVAYDGMPLKYPEPIQELVLSPSQRVDLIAGVTSKKEISIISIDNSNSKIGVLPVEGKVEVKSKLPIPSLETNINMSPDLTDAIKLELIMEGGAMSSKVSMADIMSGKAWTFNGLSGINKKPLHKFIKNQTAIINLVNNTRFPHAIHLHGHHFQVLNSKGKPSYWRDTTLVGAGKSQKISCVFNNPGKWLFHCHMLGHQAAGMKTWVEVV